MNYEHEEDDEEADVEQVPAKDIDNMDSTDTEDNVGYEKSAAKTNVFHIDPKNVIACGDTAHPIVGFNQNITANSLQIGNENVLHYNSVQNGDRPYASDCTGLPAVVETHDLNKAKKITEMLCTTQNINTDVFCNIVNVTPEAQPRELEDPQHVQIKKFRELVHEFRRGPYILITGKMDQVMHLDSLAYIPWIAVFDFDPKSWTSGLLSYVKEILSAKRSLHINSWQDTSKPSITERSTSWIFMKGTSDRADTLSSDADDYKSWKSMIKKDIKDTVKKLNKFGRGYAKFTVLVLWPVDSALAQHVQFILSIFEDIINPTVVIIDSGASKSKVAKSVLTCLETDEIVTTLELDFSQVCKVTGCLLKPSGDKKHAAYMLPTSNCLNDPQITAEKAQWLREDLEVLYMENMTGIHYDQKQLENEKDNFYRGGTLTWPWWYCMGPGDADVERDIMPKIVNHIQTHHIDVCRPGVVKLHYSPGSGGTCLSQRILWSFKDRVPCAQIRNRSGSTIDEMEQKIKFLCERTRMPVLLLLDGEEQPISDAIQKMSQGHYNITLLFVKRKTYVMKDETASSVKCMFRLQSTVSEKEAQAFGLKFSKCCSVKRQRKVKQLVREVENGTPHSIFEFGLAVHSYEYTGIRSYVKGYLQLHNNGPNTLAPWQKALAYMSLVYYYGQCSVPCYFVSSILQIQVCEYEEFPPEMKELVVKDVNEGKDFLVRVSHYLIAKEILDQILTQRMKPTETSKSISENAKKQLYKFALDFVKIAAEFDNKSFIMCQIMKKTFILRERKKDENKESNIRKPMFSPLLQDVSLKSPYTERFNILQQLTVSYPKEAHFKAHLGRLYSLCKPEEETKADKCFQEALEIALQGIDLMRFEFIPINNRFDLMRIYHMYGTMLSKQVKRKLKELHGKRIKQGVICKIADEILEIVKKSCHSFSECRKFTPLGFDEYFPYIGEMNIRLSFCHFIKQRCLYDRQEVLSHKQLIDFLDENFAIIDRLFLECFSVTDPDSKCIAECREMFMEVFKSTPSLFQQNAKFDDLQNRRKMIAAIKMKYCTFNEYGIIERITEKNDIITIVKIYEQNFQAYNADESLISTRSLDLDHREWLCAIRHKLCPDTYAIEEVLLIVQSWHERLSSHNSRFYQFVLKSLLGFGGMDCPGNSELLQESQILKQEVITYSRDVTKRKQPFEWLGKTACGTSIRRLKWRRGYFRSNVTLESFSCELEIMKGTIDSPNDNPAEGYILLDLGYNNRIPVKVYYVPAKTELKGTHCVGKRVQFVIGFSMARGYEAYFVKPIWHIRCVKCEHQVEIRTCEHTVECPRCKISVQNSPTQKII